MSEERMSVRLIDGPFEGVVVRPEFPSRILRMPYGDTEVRYRVILNTKPPIAELEGYRQTPPVPIA